MQIENAEKKYHTTSRGEHSCQYFVVFCTKYSRKLLSGKSPEILDAMFRKNAKESNFCITNMAVFPDHVQMVIDCSPDVNIQKMINKFKIDTAHDLFEMHPELRSRTSSIWTRQNFISTIGTMSVSDVLRYIEDQEEKGRGKENGKEKESDVD